MIRRIRAAWAAFRQPELIEESPEEAAEVLVKVRREAEKRMCQEFADSLKGEWLFWSDRASK